jgi:hypothetical protein
VRRAAQLDRAGARAARAAASGVQANEVADPISASATNSSKARSEIDHLSLWSASFQFEAMPA